MNQELELLVKELPDVKRTEVVELLNTAFKNADEWTAQVNALEVKNESDLMTMAMAETARKNAKSARLQVSKLIEEKRTVVKQRMASDVLEDKLLLKAQQMIDLKFKAIEQLALDKAETGKRMIQQRELILHNERLQQMLPYLTTEAHSLYTSAKLHELSDASFEDMLNGVKASHQSRVDAAKQEREEREKQETENAVKEARYLWLRERMFYLTVDGTAYIRSNINMRLPILAIKNYTADDWAMSQTEILHAEQLLADRVAKVAPYRWDANGLDLYNLTEQEFNKKLAVFIEEKKQQDAAHTLAAKVLADKRAQEKAAATERFMSDKQRIELWMNNSNLCSIDTEGFSTESKELVESAIAKFNGFKQWVINQIPSKVNG